MDFYGEGFAAIYDDFMDDVDYAAWGAYIGKLLDSHGVAPPERVADAACGTGNITLELAHKGYAVTGIDASEYMLAHAGEKALKTGLAIPFIQQNIRELETGKTMGAVVCACDGVNYLTGDKDLSYFFKSAFLCLRSGGVLAFDISSAYKLRKILGNEFFAREKDDAAYIWQNSFDAKAHILTMDITFFIKKKGNLFERHTEVQQQRAYTDKEISGALERAGFSGIETYGCFTDEPPKRDTERIQYVAIKP